MKKKCITKFLAFLTAALTCTSICSFVLTGNSTLTTPGTEQPEIIQDLENPKSGDEEPGASPQNDRNDNNNDKINPDNAN